MMAMAMLIMLKKKMAMLITLKVAMLLTMISMKIAMASVQKRKDGKDNVSDADADENGADNMPLSIWCLVFLLRSCASKVRTLSEYEIDTFAVFREEEEGSLALSIRGGVHPWLSAWGGRRIIISNHLGNLGTMGRQTDRPGRFMNHHCSKTTIAIIHVITTIMHIPPYSSSSESRSQCTSETIG